MKSTWKWALIGLGAIVLFGAVIQACNVISARSDVILSQRYPLASSTVHVVASADAIARGAHLTTVTACGACHGRDLTSGVLTLSGSTLYAPNLTRVSRTTSDAALDRAIRQGLRPDGTSELAMPSQAYVGFTDDEVASIIAYLRSLGPKGPAPKQPPFGLLLRANLVRGELRTEQAQVAHIKPPIEADPRVEAGRRLAGIACGQCHGTDLGSGGAAPGPDVTVRGYYDRAQFHTLMRTGAGVGQNLDLMASTAVASFSHFTDPEIDAIYDYLMARDLRLAVKKGS